MKFGKWLLFLNIKCMVIFFKWLERFLGLKRWCLWELKSFFIYNEVYYYLLFVFLLVLCGDMILGYLCCFFFIGLD